MEAQNTVVTLHEPQQPVLPKPGSTVTLAQMEEAEHAVVAALPHMMDIGHIQDQRDRLSAVEKYLKGKEAHLPARGAQRHLEARIGQLIGKAVLGANQHTEPSVMPEGSELGRHDRTDFRVLARALNGSCELSKDEWRQSRRALVALIKERTKEEEEAMFAASLDEKLRLSETNTLKIPDGMTPEELCRQGIEIENNGEGSSETIAKELGVNRKAYQSMKYIVALNDRSDLSHNDTLAAKMALDALNRTHSVKAPWELVEPIASKVWGRKGVKANLAETEANRFEKFDNSFSLLMCACESSEQMEIPYLSEEDQVRFIEELEEGVRLLRGLQKSIKEVRS